MSGEEQPKNLQTWLGAKCGKPIGGASNQQRIWLAHISMIAEIWKHVNPLSRPNSFPHPGIPTNVGSQALESGKPLETLWN